MQRGLSVASPAGGSKLQPATAGAVALRDIRKGLRPWRWGRRGARRSQRWTGARVVHGDHGPVGARKSTFLHVAAGLDRPTSGTVALGDTELTRLSERRLTILRRKRIGFIFQAFNLMPSLTVAQNIGLPLRLDGHRPRRS
jgi:hypothetical protein